MAGLLWLHILLFLPASACAANNRTSCICKLKWIAEAVEAYRDHVGALPEGIRDPAGKPLLSWRVQILPFMDAGLLYTKFHVTEPWNSAHNARLIDAMPKMYRCPSTAMGDGLTCYVAPRGDGTFFGPVDRPKPAGRLDDPAATIMILETDEHQAVIWTRPDDLDCERLPPSKWAGKHHWDDRGSRGCLAAFWDGKVRFVSADVDDHLLRTLVGAEKPEAVGLDLPWYSALGLPPLGRMIAPYVALSLVGLAGIVVFLVRVVRGEPTVPGEWLWFLLGMETLTHWALVASCYQYEVLPTLRTAPVTFWVLPSLVATVISIFALFRYVDNTAWRTFFILAFLLFALVTLNDTVGYQHQPVEESFVTAPSPLALGFLELIAVWTTAAWGGERAWVNRPRWHWAGLWTCALPSLWFFISLAQGLLPLRNPFVRIID